MSKNGDVTYFPNTDPAANQLKNYQTQSIVFPSTNITTLEACPVGDYTNVSTFSTRGPISIQDVNYLEEMANFVRERVPDRVVHVKGCGAFGEFVVTNELISTICKADLFKIKGQITPVAVRFSVGNFERGSSDSVRDIRGFATKFYTKEGNYDLLGLNSPVFFLRDPFLFPKLTHSIKRNPQTGLFDYNSRWDFFSLRPETLNHITRLYSDHGIPNGFRHMNGFAINTFQLVNHEGICVYNKFHWRTNQGEQHLTVKEAKKLSGTDPDYAAHDLYDAIARKNYPVWTLYIQVMTMEQAKVWLFNPFDPTKEWPEIEFPLIEVGRLTLDRNPNNVFAQIEQLAFCPANLVPGIEFSPDKILQGRTFAYRDTHRYRIGTNFDLIPVNKPIVPPVHPTIRDGSMNTSTNEGAKPNYYPNSFEPNIQPHPVEYNEPIQLVNTPIIDRFVSDDDDSYSQARLRYLSYTIDERKRLHSNIANELLFVYNLIADRAIEQFRLVFEEYGDGIQLELETLRLLNNGESMAPGRSCSPESE
ncbi:hypothetical protein RDWZM_000999 [Blomia tropicalis]|uniref:Catalase core domain-containing protein n=1 Tax=Blomia tropicalis TaxID=40697 RepID=A0A9Q0MBM5_BLOTA|nr:hypothetical protein RDWZM_000999 [Blomia tropicalis]